MDKYRGADQSAARSALVVVGLSAERAAKEVGIRDDMIRVAHRAGASIRQLADVQSLTYGEQDGSSTPRLQTTDETLRGAGTSENGDGTVTRMG